MKRGAVFGSIDQFEAFVNDPKVSVIDVKVSTCEQSYSFQECFVGVVFYEDAPKNTVELAATDNQQRYGKIADDMVRVCGCIKQDYTLDELADVIMVWSRQLRQ